MSDYTPTTDEVFHAYWSHVAYERMLRGGEPPERAEFDRWLAEHDAKVRAEALRGLLSEFGEWADEMTFVVGNELDEDTWRDTTVREYITRCIDEIEREAGLK